MMTRTLNGFTPRPASLGDRDRNLNEVRLGVLLVPNINPDAVEVHKNGKSIGVIRKADNGQWRFWMPDGPHGVTILDLDVLQAVTEFIKTKALEAN